MRTINYLNRFAFILILTFSLTAVKGQVTSNQVINYITNKTEINVNSDITTDNIQFGGNAISEESAIKIYPIPARERIFVKATENADIIIYNSDGLKEFQTNSTSNISPINLDNLSAGIYVMHIIFNEKRVTRRFIVQ